MRTLSLRGRAAARRDSAHGTFVLNSTKNNLEKQEKNEENMKYGQRYQNSVIFEHFCIRSGAAGRPAAEALGRPGYFRLFQIFF
ncbi:MAG: hypothetical protein LBT26_06605 [Clostridiales Family XIII bacterium]|nr:hypothetical protein [Clostridiales Family XIII bacterium]